LLGDAINLRIFCAQKRAPRDMDGLWAADSQLYLQKLPCRIQAAVIVIVNAGFARRFRDRERRPRRPIS